MSNSPGSGCCADAPRGRRRPSARAPSHDWRRYRDSAINVGKFSGEGAWERHPNGDEIVQIVDGATILHIMTEDGRQAHALKAGMVVPQAAWHRFEAADGESLMTTTPQPTQHLTFAIDDPRTLD
jgi:hypothetical protein